jgi:hypothetical protein
MPISPPKAGTRRAKQYQGLRWVGVSPRSASLNRFQKQRAATLKARIPETVEEANERNSANRTETRRATPTARLRNENVPEYILRAVARENYPANIFNAIAARQGITNARKTQLIRWVSEKYTPRKLSRVEAKFQAKKNAAARKQLLNEFNAAMKERQARGGVKGLFRRAANYFTKKK